MEKIDSGNASLFKKKNIGAMEIPNRFVHSSTYEAMAKESGEVSTQLINRYKKLAKGKVGLIIPGYCHVNSLGKAVSNSIGIHSDEMIPGLSRLTEAVHMAGSKIVFQLVHAGRQTNKSLTGQIPISPSGNFWDFIYMSPSKKMTEEDIYETIDAFAQAARRASDSGADGIQLQAAHGYLINQFLSPFYNKRTDQWGGTDRNRFRFLKEVFLACRRELPKNKAIILKLNTIDYTPKSGITIPLSMKYAEWLGELGIDGIEISSGTLSHSMYNIFRGDVPVNEWVASFPWWQKIYAKLYLSAQQGKFNLTGAYNLEAAKMLKPVLGKTPLILVGGLRGVSQMEEILINGHADFISLCRPFIKEPFLIKKILEDNLDGTSCISCNKCHFAVNNNLPLACYKNGIPRKK